VHWKSSRSPFSRLRLPSRLMKRIMIWRLCFVVVAYTSWIAIIFTRVDLPDKAYAARFYATVIADRDSFVDA
jgi:hypothetical protein